MAEIIAISSHTSRQPPLPLDPAPRALIALLQHGPLDLDELSRLSEIPIRPLILAVDELQRCNLIRLTFVACGDDP